VKISRINSVILIGTVAATVTVSGTAYAFWTAAGSGTAKAKSTSAVALTVAAVTPTNGDLFPGGTGAVTFTVQNTNGYNVNLNKLTSASVVSDDTTNCPNANIGITAGVIPSGGATVNYTINAGQTTGTQSIAGLLTMAAAAPDGCQGKTFTVTLNFTGTQV